MKNILAVLVVIPLTLVVISFFFSLRFVYGSAMEPTLKNGQLVIFKKYFGHVPNPDRSDIVLYKEKRLDRYSVGRVVGLPLESVMINNGRVYLADNNGKYVMTEDYLPEKSETKAIEQNKWIKIGQFEYFITGDNRNRKSISIKESLVPRDNIKMVLMIKF